MQILERWSLGNVGRKENYFRGIIITGLPASHQVCEKQFPVFDRSPVVRVDSLRRWIFHVTGVFILLAQIVC